MTRRAPYTVAGLLTLTSLIGCSGPGRGSEADGASTTRVPVGLGTVTRDSIVEMLTLTGRLSAPPGGAALLSAPAAGVVRTLRVQIGDRVSQGKVVAEIEVPELAADAWRTEAAAWRAEREATRQRQLLADGITSARQVEEATAATEEAKAAAAAARDLLARTRMTSPLTGEVQQVLVQRGERVEAGRALVEVVASDTLDLIAPVPAFQLTRLRVGLAAFVRQEGDSIPALGRVTALAPGVDSLTNAGSIVIRIPNPRHRLRPGAAAAAEIRLGRKDGVLVVPDSAIILAGDRLVVFVVGPDSIVHQRPVSRGVRANGRTEVAGDLSPGDRVVTTGAFGLEDGMRVVPIPPDAPGSDL